MKSHSFVRENAPRAILYSKNYFDTDPAPVWIALFSLSYLYFMNLISTIAQCTFLCYEKEFVTWRDSSGFNKFFYGFINILSLGLNHKIRNILFCKLVFYCTAVGKCLLTQPMQR